MSDFLILAGFIGGIVTAILAIISKIKKDGNTKKWLKYTGIAMILIIIGATTSNDLDTDDTSKETSAPVHKAQAKENETETSTKNDVAKNDTEEQTEKTPKNKTESKQEDSSENKQETETRQKNTKKTSNTKSHLSGKKLASYYENIISSYSYDDSLESDISLHKKTKQLITKHPNLFPAKEKDSNELNNMIDQEVEM